MAAPLGPMDLHPGRPARPGIKLHPNENEERVTHEIRAVAKDALVIARGSAEEMIASCDLPSLIHRLPVNPTLRDRRRLSAKMSRQLRLLRARGVIKNPPRTHRHRLTGMRSFRLHTESQVEIPQEEGVWARLLESGTVFAHRRRWDRP